MTIDLKHGEGAGFNNTGKEKVYRNKGRFATKLEFVWLTVFGFVIIQTMFT